jgi:hypothetical protein
LPVKAVTSQVLVGSHAPAFLLTASLVHAAPCATGQFVTVPTAIPAVIAESKASTAALSFVAKGSKSVYFGSTNAVSGSV